MTTKYHDQIQRIKRKLKEAKKADKDLKVFGADDHQYIINKPATAFEVTEFEEAYSIQLPECYKAFVLEVGNGGAGTQNSAAGPFYGIYPLGKYVDELITDNTKKYLKGPCVIYPKMTDNQWNELTKNIDEDTISDKQYEEEIGKLWAGILPVGSQGCTYIHGVILNGPYKGMVVNLDMEQQKPQFAFEKNFLDWYERWLDEVISGELIEDGPSWFGYNMGGTEESILEAYTNTEDEDDKIDCLYGLLSKNRLKESSLNKIIEILNTSDDHKDLLIRILCKTNYEKAKPYLLSLSNEDMLTVFQSVFWYAKDKSHEWLTYIQENINKINDEKTFQFCTYLLIEMKCEYGELLLPFTKNDNEEIRIDAFFALGELENKKDFIDTFIEGMKDSSNQVIHTTLQALSGVKDTRLLEHYKNLAEKFPKEQDSILVNLNHLLADYGLTNKTILKGNPQAKKEKK